ncbi:hypothetical protein B0H13DRAFT_1901225 [Mycena leptocephala]|nr:hypothetical protein B0H13DRAFT_1901225 [Mycena leptocephala]
MSFLLAFILYCTLYSASAQLVPQPWRQPNITASVAQRVDVARNALNEAIDNLGSDAQFDGKSLLDVSPIVSDLVTALTEVGQISWSAGSLYAQMAEFDIATNQTTYEENLKTYFELVQARHANFSTSPSYGRAAARAYVAYKNPIFLEYAIQSWWFGRSYTLSQDDVASGKIATKSFTVQPTCQNKTTAGGTFSQLDAANSQINVLATGLSALLAEVNGTETMYLQAATEAADFIRNHLYSDASTQQMIPEILSSASLNTAWHGDNGVLAFSNPAQQNEQTGDMNLLQGLGTAYARNMTTPLWRSYVGAYIGVQFNALLDLATEDASNIYGSSWLGPPSSTFSGGAQTTALSALIAAIHVEEQEAPSTPSPSPLPSQVSASESSRTHSNVALIAGAVVGSIVVVVMVGFVLWFCQRRRRGNGTSARTLMMGRASVLVPDPFNVQKYSGPEFRSKELASREPGGSTDLTGILEARGDPPTTSSSLTTSELAVLFRLYQRVQRHGSEGDEAPPQYRDAEASGP